MSLLNDVNELCVATARTVIDQVYRHVSTVWPTLIPELNVDLNQEPNKTAWEQAVAIFEYYVSYDISAQGGIQALWDYRQKFEAAKSRGEPLNEAGRAEPQQYSQGGGVVAESDEAPPVMDGASIDSQWPGGDLSQALYDWNWLDFDIPEFMLS
ncbi:hypothetical protein A9Z42_0049760 [Trichoderma parareesei]|uniref:Uncharacterized protein n=1 Tax=Trichoderma parareesei TaxID=858221 RepID=A0A2H2ZMJ6_TRIPA|nr:hypothetical protein A9Z42_0049760 [Trichoderma parareesei]